MLFNYLYNLKKKIYTALNVEVPETQIHTVNNPVIIYAIFIIFSFLPGFNHFIEIEAWKYIVWHDRLEIKCV